MKKFFLLSALCAAFLITGFALFIPAERDSVPVETSLQKGKMLGLHHLTLKEGVTPGEFEKFVRDEWEPAVSGFWPGISIMVMKGERNAKPNEYIMAFDIQSKFVRDYWIPEPGKDSEAVAALNDACDECDRISEKMRSMTERTFWADFIQVVN